MFVTKKFLSRRTLLKSAGVTLALPFLDSMVPAQTPIAKTAANVAPRFMGIFSAHGCTRCWRMKERPTPAWTWRGCGVLCRSTFVRPTQPTCQYGRACRDWERRASGSLPG